MTRLRAVVIGTGKISEEHLRFLASDTRCELAGVCDLSPALATYAATRFGAAGAYTDYREMLAKAQPRIVHVLTPPHTHGAIIRDCLDAGADVIAEKPVAPTLAELDGLLGHARSRGRRLIENHNYRFNSPVRRFERAIAAGEIGDVREVEVRMCLGIRNKGGRYADTNLPHPSHKLPAGVLHEFLTHLCYLTLRFVPAGDVVRAVWSNHGGGSLFSVDDLDALLVSGPVHARIRFCCSQAPDCFTLTVRGTQGILETDLFQPHVLVNRPRPVGAQLSPLANQVIRGLTLARAGVGGFWKKVMQVTPYEGLATFLDMAYDSLSGGGPAPVSEDDMRDAAALIDRLVLERRTTETDAA